MDEDVRAFCAAQYPRLVGALALYTGDRHLAEECAQEALTKAVRDWPRISRIDGSVPPTSPGGDAPDDGADDAAREDTTVDDETVPADPTPAEDIELVPDEGDLVFEVEQDGAHASARGSIRMELPDQLTSPEFRQAWRASSEQVLEGELEARVEELVTQLRADWDAVTDEVDRDPRVLEVAQELAECVRDEGLVEPDTPDGVATLDHLDDPASGWAGSLGALERLYAEDGVIAQRCGSALIETRAALSRERRTVFLEQHRGAVDELEAWRDETFRR